MLLASARLRAANRSFAGRRSLNDWTRQSDTLSYLRDARADREIYLIGTAHVSQRSADEVRELITLVRPTHVAVELCPQRATRLRAGDSEADFALSVQQSLGGDAGMLGAVNVFSTNTARFQHRC